MALVRDELNPAYHRALKTRHRSGLFLQASVAGRPLLRSPASHERGKDGPPVRRRHFPIAPASIPPTTPLKAASGRLVDLVLGSLFFATIAIAMSGWLYVLFLLAQAVARLLA